MISLVLAVVIGAADPRPATSHGIAEAAFDHGMRVAAAEWLGLNCGIAIDRDDEVSIEFRRNEADGRAAFAEDIRERMREYGGEIADVCIDLSVGFEMKRHGP